MRRLLRRLVSRPGGPRDKPGVTGCERGVRLRSTQRVIQHHAHRHRALGGEIGQVGRDQLPRDIPGGIAGEIMHALDQSIAGQHQPPEPRGIVA
ncbi:hypothetical protein D9M73_279440 [compost metagenome]